MEVFTHYLFQNMHCYNQRSSCHFVGVFVGGVGMLFFPPREVFFCSLYVVYTSSNMNFLRSWSGRLEI